MDIEPEPRINPWRYMANSPVSLWPRWWRYGMAVAAMAVAFVIGNVWHTYEPKDAVIWIVLAGLGLVLLKLVPDLILIAIVVFVGKILLGLMFDTVAEMPTSVAIVLGAAIIAIAVASRPRKQD